jgi:alginate O-acetyltransferase complex protein AlgI
MDSFLHPVFDVQMPPWWRYQAQMPPGVIFYLFPILIGMLLPQRWIRPYLLATSVLMIWLTWGTGFLTAICLATMLGWVLCLVGRWALRRSRRLADVVLVGGWGIANATYFSMFLLPVDQAIRDGSHLEVLLFCGPAFILIRVLHLLTDCCLGRETGSLRLDRFVLFLLFAPTFRLGPVTRYVYINDQIDVCKSQMDFRSCLWGLGRVLFGLGQLVFIDEVIDEWLIESYREPSFFRAAAFFEAGGELTSGQAVIGLYLVALRLLLGFEGYSHISLGLCLLIGIRLPENFLWPYFSRNPQVFWRRWHISLGEWLRDYIYIPLGGRNRRWAAAWCVFLFVGTWHEPTLNMLAFATTCFGGVWAFDIYKRAKAALWARFPAAVRITGSFGWFGRAITALLGGVCTFHWWVLAAMMMVDNQYAGLRVIDRIVSGSS